MNIFSELKIPGYRFLKWAMTFLIIAPLVIVFSSSDSKILSLSLKIMVLLLDAICLYIILWIIKKKMLGRYFNIMLFLFVLAIGETMMAFI